MPILAEHEAPLRLASEIPSKWAKESGVYIWVKFGGRNRGTIAIEYQTSTTQLLISRKRHEKAFEKSFTRTVCGLIAQTYLESCIKIKLAYHDTLDIESICI